MKAAENVRSFWAAKDRDESPTASPRSKEGPTMENLRNVLQHTNSWDQNQFSRQHPPKAIDLPSKLVTNSPFVEHDKTPSPAVSPHLERRESDSVEKCTDSSLDTSVVLRPGSPYKSALSSPDLPGRRMVRNKSVTFNESPEVRQMSERSFDIGSSPIYSRNTSSDEELDDEDNDEEGEGYVESDLAQVSHNRAVLSRNGEMFSENDMLKASQKSGKISSAPADPFARQARALPSIPVLATRRPLPVLPDQRASSPEQKLIATSQEDGRSPYTGLGLQLASDNERDPSSSRNAHNANFSADQAKIRRNSQHTFIDELISDTDDAEEASVSRAILHDVAVSKNKPQSPSGTSQKSPVLRSFSPSRSPEPAISRETIREKMAERRAAKALSKKSKTLEALAPHNSLAPPLPHFDSFTNLSSTGAAEVLQSPESPLSDVEFPSTVVAQRKVSDTHRPDILDSSVHSHTGTANLEMVATEIENTPEAKTQNESVFTPKTPLFTSVNYDGDEYDEDFEDDTQDSVANSEPVSSVSTYDGPLVEGMSGNAKFPEASAQIAHKDEEEEVLRALPQIPSIPVRIEDVAREDELADRKSVFSLNSLSLGLGLDLDDIGSESLGLEEYMTPEKRPETPITSRTVAPPSPTKSSDMSLDSREIATITARGIKLRTRPSMTPADATELAARRRKVSAEVTVDNDFRISQEAMIGQVRSESVNGSISSSNGVAEPSALSAEIEGQEESDPLDRIQPLAMPVLQPLTRKLSFSDINNAFDRVMQKQSRGYVVRHQSRVVHATANHAEDAGNVTSDSPKGHTRQSSSVYTAFSGASGPSSFTGENVSAHRRQGSRIPVGVHMSPKPSTAPSSPDKILQDDQLDGGRLFVKVASVKSLTLPVPKGEESFFCCTLDNGKHCVTTPWHTLSSYVKINQEFELMAERDLEFILTLQAQYTPPVMPARPKSTLGRLLNSPKRHRPTGSITSLSLSGYVGNDGSFARAHLALKHFRQKAFGRPHTMLVPVLNEWAVESTGYDSRGVVQTRQRKPYKIGEIELQVLFVPPVVPDQRQTLPTSLAQAIRDVRDAEWHTKLHCEGYLSQQGGDCPYWRRRQFKLVGSKLTAYHINSGNIRATINLSKATKLLDDQQTLTAPEVTIGRGEQKSRRKSGFAEREEGNLYVAEGFRIRFANGEAIDFYADSAAEKAKWIACLGGLIQKVPVVKAWAKVVLEHENGGQLVE